VATQTSVEIVISARDQFSPAFEQLDQVLGEAQRSGGGMEQALASLDAALAGVSRGAGEAGQSTADFAEQAGASMSAFSELRLELERQSSMLSEELALAHGERMLLIEEDNQQLLTEAATAGMMRRQQMDEALRQTLASGQLQFHEGLRAQEQEQLKARLALYQTFYERLAELAASQGRAMAGVSKSLAISAALIDTYRAANAALASVPFPLNFAAAALVLAEGLQNVQRIRQVSVAHGGLDDVPEDSTFLLRRGERVLAPRQNEDLTEFLRGERGGSRGGVVIQQLEVHVLENATAGTALLTMGAAEWRRIVSEKLIPALNELSDLGIRPRFAAGQP